MDIIGETPPRYANIDPSNFNNMSESTDYVSKILELDRIPSFTRSIQHVLLD